MGYEVPLQCVSVNKMFTTTDVDYDSDMDMEEDYDILVPFSARGKGATWARELSRTSWYQYVCTTTNDTRTLSSFNMVSVPGNPHAWTLAHSALSLVNTLSAMGRFLRSVRCPACGFVAELGVDTFSPPPNWCFKCSAHVTNWLPVSKEPYLTITWFHYACTKCQRLSMVGNDPSPPQCIHCLSARCLKHVAAAPPQFTREQMWSPSQHDMFSPWFSYMARLLALLCARTGRTWLPSDLYLVVCTYLTPHPLHDPLDDIWCHLQLPCNNAQQGDHWLQVRRLPDFMPLANPHTSAAARDAALDSDLDVPVDAGNVTPPATVGLVR